MRPLLAAVALALLATTGCGAASAPGRLDDLLATVPAEAAERGLFYSRPATDAPGFGSVLPLRDAEALLGVDPDGLTDVLETGGAPLTVLAGGVRQRTVVDAVAASGYTTEESGDWTVFTRGDAAPAGPLAAAVPAGAVRGGLLVLGDVEEVRAAATPGGAVADAPGVAAVATSLGDARAAALLTTPERIVAAAAPEGGVEAALERSGSRGDVPAWDAAALVWQEDDGEHDGAVLLAYEAAVDGHEAARALVLRAATTPLLGAGGRMAADLFERGAPRWDAETGIVRLPIRWREPDLERVRVDVEQGNLLFLAPT